MSRYVENIEESDLQLWAVWFSVYVWKIVGMFGQFDLYWHNVSSSPQISRNREGLLNEEDAAFAFNCYTTFCTIHLFIMLQCPE